MKEEGGGGGLVGGTLAYCRGQPFEWASGGTVTRRQPSI